MTTTAYNLATSTDEYVSILSDIVTLAERGADGSDKVDKAIATLSLVSSLVY